jgi:hypothetical protein
MSDKSWIAELDAYLTSAEPYLENKSISCVSVVNVVDPTGRAFSEYAVERDVRAALKIPVDVIEDARKKYFCRYSAPVMLVNAGEGQCPRELDSSVYLVLNRLVYRSRHCVACMPVLFSRVAVPSSRLQGCGTFHYIVINTDAPRRLRSHCD